MHEDYTNLINNIDHSVFDERLCSRARNYIHVGRFVFTYAQNVA